MQILEARSWQLMLLFFLSYFGSIELTKIDLELASIPLGVFSIFLIFIWFHTLGRYLHRKLENDEVNLYVVFSINCVYLFCFFIYSYLTESDSDVKSFEDAPIYVYLIGVYYLFALFQMIYYLTSKMQSYFGEEVVKKKFGGTIPLFFLLFFIPVGVLFIQPLLNQDFD